MATIDPRYWRLIGQRVVPCSKTEWEDMRTDARNFVIARTYVDPGLAITTLFIGRQVHPHLAPAFFHTRVDSDLGETIRTSRTFDDAARMHTMETQRIEAVVSRNAWSLIADASDYDA